jgi:DNA-binding HxlR family transcriptional regulator
VKSMEAGQRESITARVANQPNIVATSKVASHVSTTDLPVLQYRCPRQEIVAALEAIGGKWKALIVCELSRRSMRYHEIDAALSYVSHRVLTYELQALTKCGVISRSPLGEQIRVYQYSLTAHGYGLYSIVQDLVHWARLRENQAQLEA